MSWPRVPIRYLVVAVAMLMAMLLYLERTCISVAEGFIREDLHLSRLEMDKAVGAFFIAYALGQVPAGWLSQRYGPRLMLTLYMVGWSVFGVFIAVAQDYPTLLAARFLLGLSQAGAYPTAAILVKRWVPDRNRGLANSVVAFGGRFGGAGATWLTGLLIIAFVPLSSPATVTADDIISVDEISNDRDGALHFRDSARGDHDWVFVEIDQRLVDKYPDRQGMADAINAVIRTPGVFDGKVVFERLRLTHDARTILAKPLAGRTAAESERLNRLVVEEAIGYPLRSLHGRGWRPALLSYGVLSILAGLVVWLVVRNSPREHPWVPAGELALIEAGQVRVGEVASNAIPWRALVTSRNQWVYSAMHFTSNFGWVFLITLMPRFLQERFQVPLDQRGLMTTVPLLVAAFGMIVGGYATDALTRRLGLRWGRALPIGAMKFPCAAMLALCPWLPDPWTVVLALSLMSVCQDFGIAAVWAFAQDTGGRQVGAVIGWGNMWGNFGAGLAPPILGLVAVAFGWDMVLLSGASAFVVCGVCGLCLDASRPLTPVQTDGSGRELVG